MFAEVVRASSEANSRGMVGETLMEKEVRNFSGGRRGGGWRQRGKGKKRDNTTPPLLDVSAQ